MVLLISMLIFILVVLIYEIIDRAVFGSELKKNHFQKVFSKIAGDEIAEKKKAKSVRYFGTKEYFALLIPVSVVAFLFSIVFFRSMGIAVMFTAGSVFYPIYLIKQKKVQEKKTLNYQFRDALLSINNSVKAGASLTTAIELAHKDLQKIFGNVKVKPILYEFEIIVRELHMGTPVADALINFKNRANIEDISDFVNIALMTKKQGGNLAQVISRVTSVITDRIQVEKEIGTLIASKQMEAKILTFTPLGLVILVSVMSPGYMEPMYNTFMGKCLLLFGVILLILNYFIGKKIIRIDI